jgi:hypothetical protein
MSAITLVIGASIERLCSFAMLCRRRPETPEKLEVYNFNTIPKI